MKEFTNDLYIHFSATEKFPETDAFLKGIIRRAIKSTLAERDFPYGAEVSVTLCDNEYIHKLNREYRGVDRHTDVLSFPMYEDGQFDEAECAFGAVLGDGVEIGCGSVLAPGCVVGKRSRVYPLTFVRGVIGEDLIVKSMSEITKTENAAR